MPKALSRSPTDTTAATVDHATAAVHKPDDGVVPVSYEAGLQELERLVSELESGQMPLDRLLDSYRRGATLLAFCRDRLQAVEDQIKVLDAGTLKSWSAE